MIVDLAENERKLLKVAVMEYWSLLIPKPSPGVVR